MALRQALGESTGEVMREDALPCSRITNAFAGAASVCGFLCAWPLCVIYYGPRMTRPRLFRWQLCGAVGSAAAMAVYARLWEPACEPQNIAAYDTPKVKG
ncbi:unnamed protein product [Calypogeia fissa]